MTRILFACTANSCRSQMAEAFCRELGRDVACASAGSDPAAEVRPDTVSVMCEAGIDISSARPRGFRDLADRRFDFLVTMGCEVACPVLPGAEEVRWDVPDPAGRGIDAFREARDIIRENVAGLLERLGRLKDREE